MAKPVRFTSYAQAKFGFFRVHGFLIDEAAVRRTILEPEQIDRVRLGRWVAQRPLSPRHLLRVIYEETAREYTVVTFYPARRSRYESTHDV